MVHTECLGHASRTAEKIVGPRHRELVDFLEDRRLIHLEWALAHAIDGLRDLYFARDRCSNAQRFAFVLEPLDESSRGARGHGLPAFICIPLALPLRGFARRAA